MAALADGDPRLLLGGISFIMRLVFSFLAVLRGWAFLWLKRINVAGERENSRAGVVET